MNYTKLNYALAGLMACFLVIGVSVTEKPNLAGHLVCVDRNGRLWAESNPTLPWGGDCHLPKTMIEVMYSGW